MLHELRVENLLLMERAELRLAPGLNMLTGETGAGKTLLAHALDLLLGGRARKGIVRPGAEEAYVEGVFALPPALAGADRLPAGAEEIVLARRVWPDGRTRAYVCGRAATLADLQELGSELLSFYGQHEHRKLMLSAAQLDLLDAFAGAAQLELRGRVRAVYERTRLLAQRATELRELAGARERELDLVRYELRRDRGRRSQPRGADDAPGPARSPAPPRDAPGRRRRGSRGDRAGRRRGRIGAAGKRRPAAGGRGEHRPGAELAGAAAGGAALRGRGHRR